MFDIMETKTFMDSVHGYINVPKCFVTHIIDTEAFQRLRNIDQTGMRTLYPNAKHDRFGHSLGVFHLGCKAVDALLENFKLDDYWNISSDSNSILYWATNKVLFLIACLLHDIGHTPFSHALEEIVINNSGDSHVSLTQRLADMINQMEDDPSERIEEKDIKAAPHEKIGSLLILEQLSGNIENVFDDLIAMQYPPISSSDILYAEHYNYNPIIEKTNLSRDLCFIVRMILGQKYREYKPQKQIRNCFVSLLNGSNFDVDKLDYIIRDTKMSGIRNISIDVERLLGALTIITTTKYQNEIDISTKKDVLSELIGDENSDIHIYGKFCGTLILDTDCDVTIAPRSSFVSLTTISQGKITYQPSCNEAHFDDNTVIIQNGAKKTRRIGPENNQFQKLSDCDGTPFSCHIKDAMLTPDSSFYFTTLYEADGKGEAVELKINGWCDISIKGSFNIDSPISISDSTTLIGKIQKAVLLRNLIKEEVPNEGVYNEFVVGFSKQAVNIISNVLEARDYLYLWVYAHHKVMYYANFLIPVLSQLVQKKIEKDRFPVWSLNYDNILYLDDFYIWTAIKYLYYSDLLPNDEVKALFREFVCRKYKVSLYKSLAEYDLLFETFSLDEKFSAKRTLLNHCTLDLLSVGGGQLSAGYLDKYILSQVKNHSDLANIQNIIFVDASYSEKKIDVNNTFIRFNDSSIAAISEIPLLSNKISKVGKTNHYFYLFFDTKSSTPNEIKHESEVLKNVIKEILKNEVSNSTLTVESSGKS